MAERSTSDGARTGEGGPAGAAPLDRAFFQPYLEPGERILWIGRPGRVHVLFPKFWLFLVITLGMVPVTTIGAAAVALAVSWLEHGRLMSIQRVVEVATLLGEGVTVIVAFVVVGALASRALRIPVLRRTSYAVTSKRAMAIDRKKPATLQSAFLDTVDPFDVTERNDQSGSIAFGYKIERGYKGSDERVPRVLFDDIDNVAFIAALAKDAAARMKGNIRDGEVN